MRRLTTPTVLRPPAATVLRRLVADFLSPLATVFLTPPPSPPAGGRATGALGTPNTVGDIADFDFESQRTRAASLSPTV